MKLSGIIITALIFLSQNAYSCEDEKEVIDCNKGSEFTWNPSNDNTSSKLDRFYNLDSLITEQYNLGNFAATEELITEYLELADIYKNNWNYGNAVHDANRFLGLINYQKRKYDKAAFYLIEAGKSKGSPQLDSFGPELDLANLLLKEGKSDEVKTYLLGVQTFWEMDNGILVEWIKAIDRGEKPELNRFGNIRVSSIQILIFWLGIMWPIIASITLFFIYKRKHLSPWKFIPTAIIVGYIVMVLGSIISNAAIRNLIGMLSATLIIPFTYTVTALVQFGIPLLAIYFLSNLSKLRKVGSGS